MREILDAGLDLQEIVLGAWRILREKAGKARHLGEDEPGIVSGDRRVILVVFFFVFVVGALLSRLTRRRRIIAVSLLQPIC